MEKELYEQPATEVVAVGCRQVLMSSTRGEQRDSWDEEE
jgi:hypothetical protein